MFEIKIVYKSTILKIDISIRIVHRLNIVYPEKFTYEMYFYDRQPQSPKNI